VYCAQRLTAQVVSANSVTFTTNVILNVNNSTAPPYGDEIAAVNASAIYPSGAVFDEKNNLLFIAGKIRFFITNKDRLWYAYSTSDQHNIWNYFKLCWTTRYTRFIR
jgi:hypothetical protein